MSPFRKRAAARAGADVAAADAALEQERTLAASLARLLDATSEGVLLLGAGGDTVYANAAARRMLGGSPGRLPAAGHPSIAEVVGRARSEGRPASGEGDAFVGGRRRLSVHASPVPDGMVVLVADVTDVYRAVQVRRDFVDNVSHELKTPVAGIALLAEQLAHAIRNDPPAAERFAARIQTEAERLGLLVRDLLDLSRAESDLPLALRDLDAAEVLGEAAERVAALAGAKGIAVRVEAPAGAVVRGDETDLASALTNLLDNAVRYSPAGATVRARVERRDGMIAFVVADDGPGIASGELERIFERFYRVDKARARATGGTGLGLAIVKHVAERHGGRVVAESELGTGSTFTLLVPAEAGA